MAGKYVFPPFGYVQVWCVSESIFTSPRDGKKIPKRDITNPVARTVIIRYNPSSGYGMCLKNPNQQEIAHET